MKNLLRYPTTVAVIALLTAPAFAQQQPDVSTPNQVTPPPAIVPVPAATTPPSPGEATIPPLATTPESSPTPAPAATNQPPAATTPDTNAPTTVVSTPPRSGCVLISISMPGLDQGKPATYDAAVKDTQDGLVGALQDCNKTAGVAGFIPNSTKSARIKVTQGLDGYAYLKLPADRLATLVVTVHIGKSDWTGPRFFTSGGPIADRTEVNLAAADESQAGHLYK